MARFYNKTTNSTHIRRKLFKLRIECGFSCKDVADKACISDKYYIKIENGQSTPSRATMIDIGKALCCDKWWELYELQAVEKE